VATFQKATFYLNSLLNLASTFLFIFDRSGFYGSYSLIWWENGRGKTLQFYSEAQNWAI